MPIVDIEFPASVSVSSLTGSNGFAITGFPIGSYGGCSVSNARDVNGDGIDDLIVGGPWASSHSGVSYVLFGQSGIGSSGSINVSSLTGENGFAITGFPSTSYGGVSVSGVGDVNGDRIADLLVGAPGASGYSGISYVLFGKSGIGSSGSINVSCLTGSNGFAIIGFPAGSQGGSSVNGDGDFNGDGIADLIVGAPEAFSSTGISYVLFGQSEIGSSGNINVSSLMGANGFNIIGFPTRSWGGNSVSKASDVNGDGITDLIVGAAHASRYSGMSYVLFGQSRIGSSGNVNVSSLTGVNGFSITGFRPISSGGYSVSNAGDVNDDGIADLIVGANDGNDETGMTYVLFGQSGIGSSGSISVTSLTGSNGFAITGLRGSSLNGYSVSGAGDFNGDGIADLFVGAPYASSNTGTSYVLFGQHELGSSGNINVANLTGSNGFAVTGFPASSQGGWSVNGAGDFNGDGIADLVIGAPSASSNRGSSYVIFGGYASPALLFLSKNQLTLNENQILTLSSQYLNVTNLKNPAKDATLQFTLNDVQHGRFYSVLNPDVSLTSFTQQQIQRHQIQFAHDGSGWPPSYNVIISYGRFAASAPQSATITFYQSFILANNQLTINQGQLLTLTAVELSANDLYNAANNPNLIFSVTNLQHGHFALTSAPTTAITHFTQAQVQSGAVQYIHDNSINPPSYSVAVINGETALPAQAATISFDAMPIFINNHLRVNQGQTVILTTNDLSAINPYDAQANLSFTITQIKNGFFALIGTTTPITAFTPAQIQQGQIQFIPDGGINPPSYSVSVSDGRMTSSPQSSTIFFNEMPVIVNNHLTITQGQTIVLTSTELSATDKETLADDLVFTAHVVEHGQFEMLNTPGIATTIFAQQLIRNGFMKFITDGSSYPPAYNISVSDGAISSPSKKAIINFTAKPDTTSPSNPVSNAIIGAVVSGVVGLFFLALKLYLERKATRSLHNALEGGKSETEKRLISYQKEVIKPIANKVFDRIKTTKFLGYRSDKVTKEYVAAIESIVSKLSDLGVDLDLEKMSTIQQNKLLNEIAKQTRLQVVADYSCCSCAYVCSFFKPEATPQQLEDNTDVIAAAVQAAMRSLQAPKMQRRSEQKELPEEAELREITTAQIATL